MDVEEKIEATIAMQDAVENAVAKRLPPDILEAIGRTYAGVVGISKDYAAELVKEARGGSLKFQKIIPKFEGCSEVPAAIRKTTDPSEILPRRREKRPHEKEDFSSINPDPELVGEEDKKMEPTNAKTLKAMQACVRAEVAIKREANPRLTESQARAELFAEFPALYPSLRKLAHGPENELAKRSSSAQLEAATKTEELLKAHPELTKAQAYTKAVLNTPGLMKRLLHNG
jgi:hypothetical protein